jgi:RNA recognition motif-containing protein
LNKNINNQTQLEKMPSRTELFVGNLDRDISRKEIEDVFDKYGRLLRCDVKNRGMIH